MLFDTFISISAEMEFLDINSTNDFSLLLHVIHGLSTSDSTSVLKIHTYKSAKQELKSFRE
jgi:hypothetical protein